MWSKLEKTALWNMCHRAHDQDRWRGYHGFHRVRRLYQLAETLFMMPYDASLDRAILCRSAVLSHPQPARASAEWMSARLPRADDVARDLILSTQLYMPGKDNRLIFLELADFMLDDLRPGYVREMVDELSSRFPDVEGPDLRRALSARFRDIIRNIRIGLVVGPRREDEVAVFSAILRGIESAIKLVDSDRDLVA